MRFTQALGWAAVVGLATAAAVPKDHIVHEKRDVPRSNVKRMESNVRLPIRVGLKSNKNAEALAERWLMDAAHPQSEKYGKHWTQDDVISAFAPTKETVDAVAHWLIEAGGIAKERITHTDNKAWLAFDATVEEAEALLHTCKRALKYLVCKLLTIAFLG
jgi:tripeptidyl-peptidase-1